MMKTAILCLTGAMLWQATAAVAAATEARRSATALTDPGERIALQGAGAALGACAACHGAMGEGVVSAGFPRLAGQPAFYLARQLHGYADGRRRHDVMTPIARSMTAEQIEAVAAYYAALNAPGSNGASATADAGQLERGQELAHVGDEALRVQACVNCHGPGGTGEPPRIPYLAGQVPAYLAASMAQWRDGGRNTDPSQQMPHIARRLSNEDIQAVAAYFASRPAPAPAASRVNVPRGSASRPVGPGAASAAQPRATEGVGVEQGGAATGGNPADADTSGASNDAPSREK